MSIHPAVASRFHLLEGIGSAQEAMADPEKDRRFREFIEFPTDSAGPDVANRDTELPGPHGPVPVRIYEPADGGGAQPALVWLHGGAFMFGDLDMPEADRTAREICARAEAVVISVDYRLAIGGVHYPVPLDDCVAAARWVRDHASELCVDPSRISVGGASAGANLASGTVLRLRDEDGWSPQSVICVYPMVHLALPELSPTLAALMTQVPGVLRFTPQACAGLNANYLGGAAADGYAMPALAELEGMCPVVIVNAEYDDLRASGEAFAAALASASNDVRQVLAPGMLHGFLNLPAEVGPIGQVLDLMARTVAELSSISSPTVYPDLVH